MYDPPSFCNVKILLIEVHVHCTMPRQSLQRLILLQSSINPVMLNVPIKQTNLSESHLRP